MDEWVNNLLNIHDKKDQMIESLNQDLLAKENMFLALEGEEIKLNQEKLMCDAICDISDLIQKIDSSCDTCNLVDANNDGVHKCHSCCETHTNDPSDIYEGELDPNS